MTSGAALKNAEFLRRELRRIRADEYHRMIDAGVFDEDERVELLEGMIVAKSPQKESHAIVIERLCDRQFTGLPPGFVVRCQLPLALSEAAEPEPDVAILDRAPPRSSDKAPDRALVVFEVAGESLRKDRLVKGPLYASAGIPEYVIANLDERRLEVHRDPDRERGEYSTTLSLGIGEEFRSSVVLGLTFAVADLFR